MTLISYHSSLKKKDIINNFLRSKQQLPFSDEEFDIVYRIVEVFRALVNIFSDPSTRLSSAFPLIEGASETLQV